MKYLLCLYLMFTAAFATFGQAGCPVFQPGNPGQPNSFVTFYTQNGTPVVTCFCQLTGNELKCSICKPPSALWYYYTITINGQLVICYNPVVLGVDWDFFDGQYADNHITLNWGTLTETNNKRFNIERSADGQKVEQIGWTQGSGNTVSPQRYTYIDNNPSPLYPYYRIVQEDYDGMVSSTSWILVYDIKESVKLHVMPNPSSGTFQFNVNSAWGSTDVAIYDVVGRMVHTQSVTIGENNFAINLPSGKYFLVINGEQQTVRAEVAII